MSEGGEGGGVPVGPKAHSKNQMKFIVKQKGNKNFKKPLGKIKMNTVIHKNPKQILRPTCASYKKNKET